MKVIDLLNRIANGEEVPKKTKIKQWENNVEDEDLEYELFDRLYNEDFELNDEVEIIEEDKKIEKLPILNENDIYDMVLVANQTRRKINEIIYKINKENNV